MIAKCISCHCEDQRVTNEDPCPDCGAPMQSIGSDYMSNCDESVTSHKIPQNIPDQDAELPLDFMLSGVDCGLRCK